MDGFRIVKMRWRWVLALVLALSLVGCGGEVASLGAGAVKEKANPSPLPTATLTPHAPTDGVLLGVYPSFFLQYAIDEIERFDVWIEPTGKRISIAATFMDFEDPRTKRFVPKELQAAWAHGYIPFVNLSVGNRDIPRTAEEIATGELDGEIQDWARAYARWARSGEKRAFIALLQEMNGYWTSYGEDPKNFKAAYHRIQEIFYEEGVPREAVSWVFSPNGWAREGHAFERYYPGDEVVDVVGFNSFNFGTCSAWPKWETFPDIYLPYLQRLQAMAPEKPIFVSSMGTVSEGGDQGAWLVETYQGLADYPHVQAILYFNRWEKRESLPHCADKTDYQVFYPKKGEGEEDFWKAIALPEIMYYPPESQAMGEVMFGTRLRR